MITVSVCMITYNHENYICKAIDGVLMQKTNFNLELILSNDASTDNTHKIIKNYILKHPKSNLIKYTNQKINLGIMPNFLFAINQCKGKYIAMCEGDDYWITNDKLQKQVDILEANVKFGMIYTGVTFYNQKTKNFIQVPPRFAKKKEEVIPMMLESKYIEFATTVFKSELLSKVIKIIKPELKNAVIGDTRILLETANQSNIHFLNEITTVYRISDGSASYPKQINKYIFALLDTYNCRKNFVIRNNFNTKLLGYSVCNTNKSLINKAFVSTNYKNTLKLLKHLMVIETFKYCKFRVFREKISLNIIIKLILAPFGIGILKQKYLK